LMLWQDRALKEKQGSKAFPALLALARSSTGRTDLIVGRLNTLLPKTKAPAEKLFALRVYQVALSRHAMLEPALAAKTQALLESLGDDKNIRIARETFRLLVHFQSPDALPRGMSRLAAATDSEERVFYLFHLRLIKNGWTAASREKFFEILNAAEQVSGGRQYYLALANIRKDVAETLTREEKESLGSLLQPPPKKPHSIPARSVVKEWKMEDLAKAANADRKPRPASRGREAAIAAQCVSCHRVSHDPTLPFEMIGPDLTSVGMRFSRQDLLDHIINPSKVIDEKFRAITVELKDGSEVTGQVEGESEATLLLRPPLQSEPVQIDKKSIVRRTISTVSPMPEGLLNVLNEEEILDLLAYLRGAATN
jgi:putative heme-binding domain-containing protein